MVDAAMAAQRANEEVLRAKLAEYRRYQQTDEYKAAEGEKERIREQHRQEWLAFAVAGLPVSKNLVTVLTTEFREQRGKQTCKTANMPG